ncbi:hypothetical protein A2U01_0088150, partial [Trifolium medium]|nr:hypothetical protein [Trifolium medium]
TDKIQVPGEEQRASSLSETLLLSASIQVHGPRLARLPVA